MINLMVKKLFKAFIPYGILVLKRIILRKFSYRLIKNNKPRDFLFESTIEYISDPGLGDNIVKILHKNYEYPFFLRNNTTDVGTYKAIIENEKYEFQVRETPDVIIDAGANIGLSVIYFATNYPSAKIIAIEPEDANYKLLEKNTEGYKNVLLIKAALWDSVGVGTIFGFGVGRNDAFMVGMENDYKHIKEPVEETTQTKTVTVEKILEDCNFEKIDILKIDIEGSEKEVFEKSSSWIGKVNAIIIELHERRKKGCNKSFYKNTGGFGKRCENGEDVYLSKDNYIKMIR